MAGDKQRNKSKRDGRTSSEGQALDSFSDDLDPVSAVVHQLDVKEDMSVVLVATHTDKTQEPNDKDVKPVNMLGQVNRQNDSQEPEVNALTSSIPDLMIQEMYKVALTNQDQIDTAENEWSSSTEGPDLRGDDMEVSHFSHVEHAGRDESDEELSPSGPVTFEVAKVIQADFDQEEVQEGRKALAFNGQVGIQLEHETRPSDEQMDALKGYTAPSEVLEESLDKGQIQQLSEEDLLPVGVPEIIVSSPVPTDDESSYDGSAGESGIEGFVGEGDVNEVQAKAEQRPDENDSQCDVDLSWTSQTFKHEDMESHKTAEDSSAVPTESKQENASTEASSGKSGEGATVGQPSFSAVQGSVPNLGERASNLLSQLRSEIASMKSARLSSVVPIIAPEDDADKPDVDNNQGHVDHETSQKRDLSYLESQDRDTFQVTPKELDTFEQALHEHCSSDQASKKRAIPEPSSQELGTFYAESEVRDTSEPESQECNTIQTVSQGRDPSQPGPVSAVTYGLPLFEDVDSTCTSFSLDDYDPNVEEALNLPSEIGDRFDDNEGENKGTI